MIRRFRKVAKDLYRGSAPSPVDVVNLKNKLGINKIVSLDKESGDRIHNIAKHLGINHVMMPIEGRASLMNLFMHDFKKLFLEGGPTFIHCREGKDRTGLVSAIIKCKYFNEDPDRAIAEAKSLGFGLGMPPMITNLYESLIIACKPIKYSENTDIVSQERDYIDDNRGSILESGPQGSFAPYLDQTKTYPYDSVYNSYLEQSPTRENYKATKEYNKKEEDVVPLVGLFNNDAGVRGFGPTESMNGFFYE